MERSPPLVTHTLIESLQRIVTAAGAAIMEIYATGFTVERKADESPLTRADLESQRVIIEGLREITPAVPVLSEESAHAPWSERRAWRELWIVDPLDGTREFVKRNGEFAINVALVVDHEPVLGMIGVPANGSLYWGSRDGAWHAARDAAPRRLHVSPAAQPLRVACSRSHQSPQTAAYLARLPRHRTITLGSALKFCLIAAGEADLYPRFGATSEWDTAAGQAIVEAAGGRVTRLDGHRLRYNCRESLTNGDFVAFGDPAALPG